MCIYILVHFFHYIYIYISCPIACMDVQERFLTCRNPLCRGGIATHKICGVLSLVSNVFLYVQCRGMHAISAI